LWQYSRGKSVHLEEHKMAEFKAAGWFEIKGIGWEAAVTLDRDTRDFSHLLQRPVVIDGQPYVCIGVHRFGHQPPWRKGEHIGLVVHARHASSLAAG
jgi:hypothetical protein